MVYNFGKHNNKIPTLLESAKNLVQLITLQPASFILKNDYAAIVMDHKYLHLQFQGLVTRGMHFSYADNRLPHLSGNWYWDNTLKILCC